MLRHIQIFCSPTTNRQMTTASSVEKRKEIEESHQEAADIPETKKAKVEVAENAGVERRRSGRSKKQVNMKETDNEEENEEEAEEAQTPASKKKKETSKAQLAVGDTLADNLNVLDQNDQEHDLKSLFADKAGVIFFYPKANTPGCTTQACGFRDNYAVFEEHGYQVFGMSADTPKSQSSWKEKHSLPYSLLSDRSKV
jgi:peroxiredoxin Q/BCP